MSVSPSIVLAVLLAVLAGGCVTSKEPVFGPDTRVVPFASGTRFQIYQRDSDKDPWVLDDQEVVLVAGNDKIVRELDDSGAPSDDERYTFHSLGANRYLAQGDFGDGRFAYGLLEVRGGEAFLTGFQCSSLDATAMERVGVKVDGDDCEIDGVSDRAGFLRQLAARPTAPLIKYVPKGKK